MDKEELIRRHELVTSSEYAAIRQRLADYIIDTSTSSLNPDLIRGMLMAIKHVDSWEEAYQNALRKRKEQ